MYKLIFADDEALVRNSVAKLIQWGKSGFELVGCCSNGHELLEMVEKDTPDIVITDINMPFVSGIEVARKLKSDYPTVKIIFLTGYDDFNYAQQAIDLKVLKYILKPVTAENLSDCLDKTKKILDNECLQRRNVALLEDFYYQNKAVLQNIFLNCLFTTEVSDAEVVKKLEFLELDFLASKQFQVAILMGDDIRNEEWNNESERLMNFSVYNISKEIIKDREMGSAIIGNGSIIALLTNANDIDEENWKEEAIIVLEEIRASIEKHLEFTVSVGVGSVYHSYNNIHRSYDEALSALGYRYAIGTNRIIIINDIEPQRNNAPVFSKEKELQLLASIKANNKNEMFEIVDSLINDAACHTNMEQLRSYVISMIINIVREAESINLDTQELLRFGDIRYVLDLKTVKELQDTVLKVCGSLMESISQNRKNSCSAFIEQAKCFIQEHFANYNISVDMVSQHLHLSTSYFRAIFKKETGTTFVNYLTELRMKKARDLICSTNMKIYQIAEAVGYSDPHYFSYCFKKHFDMAPNDLRESLV